MFSRLLQATSTTAALLMLLQLNTPSSQLNGRVMYLTKDESSCNALARHLKAYSYEWEKVDDKVGKCFITRFVF